MTDTAGTNCAECEHAYSEPWPNKREVLRCGNVDSMTRRGYVVCIYRAGGEPSPTYPAPVWCPKITEQSKSAQAEKGRNEDG